MERKMEILIVDQDSDKVKSMSIQFLKHTQVKCVGSEKELTIKGKTDKILENFGS